MRTAIFCFSAYLLGFGTQAAATDRIVRFEPGLWEYTHTLEIPGLLSPTSTPKTECISADDATLNLAELLSELATNGKCEIDNVKDTLNTVELDLACKPEIGTTVVNAGGHVAFRYGRTKITGHATGKISAGASELFVDARGEARRIGRCQG